MVYKKSKFLYFLKIGSNYYVIQTLQKVIFEIDLELWNLLKKNEVFYKSTFQDKSVFDILIKNKILLSQKFDEIEKLKIFYKNKEEVSSLESLHIIPTLRCTLNCKYCFVFKNNSSLKKRLDMDFETARKGIDFFFEKNTHPNPLVTFYGGEPLIKGDLMFKCVDYIEKILKRKIKKKIITNATIVTEDIAKKLKKYKFDVSVSIDGNEKAHDTNRINWEGKDSFRDTIRGYRILQKAGIEVKILCTVGPHNLKNLEENVKFLLSLKPIAIALNLPKKIEGSELEKGLIPEFMMKKYIKALEICYKNKTPELHFADLIYGFLRKGIKYRPCSGCGSQIAIAPNGSIGPCQAYVASGKYFVKMPKEKEDLYKNKVFEKWRNVNCFTSKNCSQCYIMPVCYGDCPFDRESRSRSLLTPSPLHCYSRKVMFDYLLKRIISKQKIFFKS